MTEENKIPIAELYEHFRFKADPKQSPIRVDKFLMDRIQNASRSKIQNAIKEGAILVDNCKVKANYKVKPGHVVTLILPKPPPDESMIVAENIPLDIRYEDEDLMIVYKPPGMVVHPGVGVYSGTLVNGLAYYLNKDKNVEGKLIDRPGLVHRIDKDTSGILVIGKNEDAIRELSKQFFQRTIERRYHAIVWGEPESDTGTIEGNIGRNPNNRLHMWVFPEGERGKHAVTHYKVLERLYYVSLIECKLETGRTHQIRVHMKYVGHPLFNDSRYGGNRILKGTVFSKYRQFVENTFEVCPRQALHAKSLGFTHPRTGEFMRFETDLPDDMLAALERWRGYLAGRKELK